MTQLSDADKFAKELQECSDMDTEVSEECKHYFQIKLEQLYKYPIPQDYEIKQLVQFPFTGEKTPVEPTTPAARVTKITHDSVLIERLSLIHI